MPPGVVRISLLGPVTMSIAGRPVDLPGHRIRVLLATLAVAAGSPLPTDQLAEQVWTDRPPVHLRQSVHTLVTRLRRVIGADRIRTTGDGYVLAVDPADVDALVFEEWLRRSAELDGVAAVDAITDALALWAGPPERSTLGWADDLRAERLIELYVGAVERRVDLELRTDGLDPQNSLPALRDLATRFPLRETLWARLIRVLDAAGRKAEALETYERVRVRISDELGVDPGAELTGLHAQLLATDGVQPASPANGGKADGPRQLPLDIPHFTGREEALAVLDEIAAGPATLVAIDGPGGVGKTTVAVHWAHSALARYPGGQVFLNLRGYSAGGPLRPAQALAILLGSVGVPQERIPDDPDARAALWRSTVAQQDLVLILDNARDANQVRPLLPGSGAFVIVTSRNQLRGLVAREGARRISLDPFTERESAELFGSLLPGATTELADLCGRLPLAMVIAAERHADPAVVTAELAAASERLSGFELGDDPLTSVRAVFFWSYQALSAESARLFRLLGLYPGGRFGLEAAAALTGEPAKAVRTWLNKLEESNLVGQPGRGEYEFHDLLRAYAAELVRDDPDAGPATARLLDWMARSAKAANLARGGRYRLELLGAPLDGVSGLEFGTAEEALTWFRREVLTLLTAVRAGVEWGHPRLAAALASCLSDVLELDKTADETIIETFAIGRQAAAESGDRALEAFVGNQYGIALRLAGRDRDSVVVLHEVAELFDAIGENSGAAMVRCNLGIAYDELGEPEKAIEQLTLALDGAEDMDRAQALNNLAFLYLGMGQGGEAVRTAKAAVDLTRARGWERGLYYCVDTLGQAFHANGELDAAITSLSEAARMAEEQKIGAAEVRTLTALGRAYQAADRLAEARRSWHQALLVADRTGPTQHFDVTAIQRLLDETA